MGERLHRELQFALPRRTARRRNLLLAQGSKDRDRKLRFGEEGSKNLRYGIYYSVEPDLTASEFREILVASTLAERRPADDLTRLDRMLRNADIIMVARDAGRIVGVARAITDFAYCCYLSDLAVHQEYQRQGIGKRLITETRVAAGEMTTLVLVAAPLAENYYPRIGMTHFQNCWAIPRDL